MTLANRARQVADAAPLHQSAAVLRECAEALDVDQGELDSLREFARADRAEIERLRADLAAERRGQGFEELLANVEDEWNSLHDYLQPPCQCPSCKGAQRHDYSRGTPADGHWDMAAQWAHDIRVHVDTLRADLAALRAAVVGLPEYSHVCVHDPGTFDYVLGAHICNCGAAEGNAALAAARKLAGLGEW